MCCLSWGIDSEKCAFIYFITMPTSQSLFTQMGLEHAEANYSAWLLDAVKRCKKHKLDKAAVPRTKSPLEGFPGEGVYRSSKTNDLKSNHGL